MTVEFDCDIEGDGDDGWEDDFEDESMSSEEPPQQQLQQAKEEDEDDSDEDMAGPGKKTKNISSWW